MVKMAQLAIGAREKSNLNQAVKSKEKAPFARTKVVKARKGTSLVGSQGDSQSQLLEAAGKEKFVKMRSETQGPKDIHEDDRDARINFTLDMVANDLVTQGHINPAKAAYMLKSEEMKEHVGRICDEIAERRKSEFKTEKSKPLYLKKAVKPAPPNANKGSNNKFDNNEITTFDLTKKLVKSKVEPQTSQGIPSVDELGKFSSKKLVKKSAKIFEKKDSTMKQVTKKALVTKSKKAPKDASTLNSTSEIPSENRLDALLNYPSSFQNEKSNVAPFRTRIDLGGFSNDNISLDLNGRRLVVVGFRPRDKVNHARKVTEIIDIPIHVVLDNLHITRRKNGTLVIEELVPALPEPVKQA